MVGLIDCNNFFVSCERVFNPRLQGRPVVVLSGNDGCVIARSNEAKQLGIAMGEPYFKVRQRFPEGTVALCSSNHVLYGNMSRRVMSVVRRRVGRIEQYSIDESFMDFDGVAAPAAFGRELVAMVKRWTGIPVSIGVAPTKTLAKVASKYAKRYAGYRGCCVIDNEERRVAALRGCALNEVWGIGRRHLVRLRNYGMTTALDLARWSAERAQSEFGVVGLRLWRELNGHPALALEEEMPRQSISHSRTFAGGISDFETLRGAVADFAVRTSDTLRRQHGRAGQISLFLRTDRFRTDLPQYEKGATLRFDVPTADPRELAEASGRLLRAVFLPGLAYRQAGVTLSAISSEPQQGDLFDHRDRAKQQRLLRAIDDIKHALGRNAIGVGSQADSSRLQERHFETRNFTGSLDDIIRVKLQ